MTLPGRRLRRPHVRIAREAERLRAPLVGDDKEKVRPWRVGALRNDGQCQEQHESTAG